MARQILLEITGWIQVENLDVFLIGERVGKD